MMTRDNNPNPVTKAVVMPGRTWAEAEGLRPSGASLSCSSIYLFILNHDRSSDGRRPKTTCYFVWGLQRSEAYHEAGKYKQKSQCFVICWIFCPSIDANFLAWRLPWPKCQKKEKKFESGAHKRRLRRENEIEMKNYWKKIPKLKKHPETE